MFCYLETLARWCRSFSKCYNGIRVAVARYIHLFVYLFIYFLVYYLLISIQNKVVWRLLVIGLASKMITWIRMCILKTVLDGGNNEETPKRITIYYQSKILHELLLALHFWFFQQACCWQSAILGRGNVMRIQRQHLLYW